MRDDLLNIIIRSGDSRLSALERRLTQIEAELRQIREQLAAIEDRGAEKGQ